eukprot:CAMPEP_0177247180 /NCGR_PEP_ID=MMETSP0367-20130122/51429_1 /TAXON_ID=447022 ORGANISM="Scrippsiella hangoei-like, Strain SHHI-4" /NCGR_SAMPLE_ID=MMETSP0367 /ASSEMBLY_ACC=CAM_ASM_000362 /LENGTH=70 /DNA_ID=CAMNT_0018699297 /DNA_START=48 /DNA_END=256 /DNA_ORIENTATION=-
MGRLSNTYTKEKITQALRSLGEEPLWNQPSNTQFSCRLSKFQGAVVNVYSTGTVMVQGAGDAATVAERYL